MHVCRWNGTFECVMCALLSVLYFGSSHVRLLPRLIQRDALVADERRTRSSPSSLSWLRANVFSTPTWTCSIQERSASNGPACGLIAGSIEVRTARSSSMRMARNSVSDSIYVASPSSSRRHSSSCGSETTVFVCLARASFGARAAWRGTCFLELASDPFRPRPVLLPRPFHPPVRFLRLSRHRNARLRPPSPFAIRHRRSLHSNENSGILVRVNSNENSRSSSGLTRPETPPLPPRSRDRTHVIGGVRGRARGGRPTVAAVKRRVKEGGGRWREPPMQPPPPRGGMHRRADDVREPNERSAGEEADRTPVVRSEGTDGGTPRAKHEAWNGGGGPWQTWREVEHTCSKRFARVRERLLTEEDGGDDVRRSALDGTTRTGPGTDDG